MKLLLSYICGIIFLGAIAGGVLYGAIYKAEQVAASSSSYPSYPPD